MKLNFKSFILFAFTASFALFVPSAIGRTFAERGRELGQKLDDAEAKLKKEAQEAKKKAEETAAKLRKKADKVVEAVEEEVRELDKKLTTENQEPAPKEDSTQD